MTMSWHKRRLVAVLVATGLALAALPAAAAASGSPARGLTADGFNGSGSARWASPAGQSFASAVYRCERETARGTLHDLRACVGGLVVPDPTQAETMDLWSIFMYCLSFMMDSGPDAPYPSTEYEARVNECLGL
jgi:hypothetical protein